MRQSHEIIVRAYSFVIFVFPSKLNSNAGTERKSHWFKKKKSYHLGIKTYICLNHIQFEKQSISDWGACYFIWSRTDNTVSWIIKIIVIIEWPAYHHSNMQLFVKFGNYQFSYLFPLPILSLSLFLIWFIYIKKDKAMVCDFFREKLFHINRRANAMSTQSKFRKWRLS